MATRVTSPNAEPFEALPRSSRFRWALLATTSLALGCVQLEQVNPPDSTLSGIRAIPSSGEEARPFAGLELEENLLGSLEDLTFEPGLTVVSVADGSPAELAGVQRGDKVLVADDLTLEGVDQWAALMSSKSVGEELDLRVERDGGLHDITIALATTGSGQLAPATDFIEHWKGRLIVGTRAGGGTSVVELVSTLPESPFADLKPGSVITGLDGESVQSAAALVRELAGREFGEAVELEVRQDGEVMTLERNLWSPPRRLTELGAPILFGYEASADGETTSFTLIDLWLISLFHYERTGLTKEYRLLTFFVWETGVGALQELPTEGMGS